MEGLNYTKRELVVEFVNCLRDCVDKQELNDALGEASILVEGQVSSSVIGRGWIIRHYGSSALRYSQLLSVVSELLTFLVPLFLFDQTDWDSCFKQVLEWENKWVPLICWKMLANLQDVEFELIDHHWCDVFL